MNVETFDSVDLGTLKISLLLKIFTSYMGLLNQSAESRKFNLIEILENSFFQKKTLKERLKGINTAQKMKFSIKDLFSTRDQIRTQFPADLVTFTEEILNVKLHFLCCVTAHEQTSQTSFCSRHQGQHHFLHLKDRRQIFGSNIKEIQANQ